MKALAVFLCFVSLQLSKSQSLLQELEEENKKSEPQYQIIEASFKAIRLINGQTSETTEKRGLNMIISHRFGEIKQGIGDFFGIDFGTIRLGLDYGLTDKISLGIGRSSNQKLYDAYSKIKLLRQCTGKTNIPISLTWYSNFSITTIDWWNPTIKYNFNYRISYVHEAIVARKFSAKLSSLIVAGIIHRNLVTTKSEKNTLPYVGIGFSRLISNRVALTGEYYYQFAGNTTQKKTNSFSIGLDIETGGHVFQLHFSNSLGMTEKIFIPENTAAWHRGEISFGFNIIRTFKL